MAVTRLERKLKRDRAKSKRRIATIKRLNAMPPTKNIDIEAIKAEFEKKKGGAAKAKADTKPTSEAKKEVKPSAKAETAPAEVKEAPKKEAPKKEEKAETIKEAPAAKVAEAKESAKEEKKSEEKEEGKA